MFGDGVLGLGLILTITSCSAPRRPCIRLTQHRALSLVPSMHTWVVPSPMFHRMLMMLLATRCWGRMHVS